jgi:hypothetical protein
LIVLLLLLVVVVVVVVVSLVEGEYEIEVTGRVHGLSPVSLITKEYLESSWSGGENIRNIVEDHTPHRLDCKYSRFESF